MPEGLPAGLPLPLGIGFTVAFFATDLSCSMIDLGIILPYYSTVDNLNDFSCLSLATNLLFWLYFYGLI